MNRHSVVVGAGAVLVTALLACKSTDDAAPTPVQEPAATTTPVGVAPPKETAEAPVADRDPTPPADEPQSRTGIPTEGTSKPPTLTEWNAVGEITVRHSTPLGCETKLVREWLRVSCRTPTGKSNQILGASLTSGKNPGGIPAFVKAGVASIVMPVRKGGSAVWTFNWSEWGSRQLNVSWPNGAPRPTIEFDRTAP